MAWNGAKTSLPCATLWMAWHARPPEQLRGAWHPCYLSSGTGCSEMVSFIQTQMSLAVARSNTLFLRSERMHTWHRRAPEDGSAIAAAPSSTDCPDPVPIDCTIEDVEVVANRLHGSAGCSSVDAALLKTMLLRFQQASTTLRVEMVLWVHWLANTSPPWAAYRAMKQGRLVALDKQPGVRPLGIGEIWLRAVSKCVLKDCGKEGKDACGSTQLCAGLEAGIEGALHAAEWQYLCRVEPDVGPSLQPIEEAIRKKFLPSLFDFKEPISDDFRRLLAQGVKQGGIAIRDPVEGASRLHQASTDATAQLVESLSGSTARAERVNKGKEILEETSSRGGRKAKKRIDRLEKSGSWLSCIPDRFQWQCATCLEVPWTI
eukprot:CCRYP_008565-RA/>CCRYP_008565-RA protein AED:0.42 eAED:0.42 QI:0/0/0/1/0.33/0/4/0/373